MLRLALSVLLSPRLRWAGGLAAATLFLYFHPSPRQFAASVAQPIGRRIHERAAFNWQDHFEDGFTEWLDPKALAPADAGSARVRGLALLGRKLGAQTYEVNFSARLRKKAIGWVVRAETGPEDYYVFKLLERRRGAYELIRYSIVDGRAAPAHRESVPVAVRPKENGYLEISVHVTDRHILTLVNGFGVDYWKQPPRKTSGVGFLAERGESFLVRALIISGNDDLMGRLAAAISGPLSALSRS